MDYPIIIVGAGQGGLQLAESLRKERYDGDILLLGDEPHAPYARPPLSKALLLGEMSVEQLTLRNPAALQKKRIELKTDVRVTAIEPGPHKLTFNDGGSLTYAKLGLATGSRARDLPIDGIGLRGVHRLRTLDDVAAIQQALERAQKIAIIGGGFIGLEMAAVARKLAKEVVLLEAAERLMARVVAQPVSDYFLDLHRQQGVDVRLNTVEEVLQGSEGRVTGLKLSNGETLDTDLVVLGVGIIPNAD